MWFNHGRKFKKKLKVTVFGRIETIVIKNDTMLALVQSLFWQVVFNNSLLMKIVTIYVK